MLTLAAGTFAYAVLDKDVQLSVDGANRDVSTTAGTVGQMLADEGITVGQHDVVAPGAGTALSDGTRIAVQFGRQVTVTVDGKSQTFWTTATTVDQALRARRIDAAGGALSTSRSAAIGRDGIAFALSTVKTITIDNAGRKQQLRTTASTVRDALSAARIRVDADDKLSVGLATPLADGTAFTFTRIDKATVTKKSKVEFRTTYANSNTLDKGESKVKTQGVAGVRTTTFTEVRHNGKIASRATTSSKVTTKPRDKVVLRGTREVVREVVRRETSQAAPRQTPRRETPSVAPKRTRSSGSSGNNSGPANVGSGGGQRSTAFITGYTYWDNSPPGSAQIARPQIHDRAGGTGTWKDPITVAVGFGPRFPFGTRFYLPELKKYFIVEDLCGACSDGRNGGAYTLDIWLDGSNTSSGAASSCAARITGTAPAIKDPSSNLPVDSGSVC